MFLYNKYIYTTNILLIYNKTGTSYWERVRDTGPIENNLAIIILNKLTSGPNNVAWYTSDRIQWTKYTQHSYIYQMFHKNFTPLITYLSEYFTRYFKQILSNSNLLDLFDIYFSYFCPDTGLHKKYRLIPV